MLLIELGIYRNDIISLRIDSKDNFYGDNLGLTKKVKNKKQFVKCFQKKPKNNNELFIKNINSFKKNPDIILNRLIKIYKNI